MAIVRGREMQGASMPPRRWAGIEVAPRHATGADAEDEALDPAGIGHRAQAHQQKLPA